MSLSYVQKSQFTYMDNAEFSAMQKSLVFFLSHRLYSRQCKFHSETGNLYLFFFFFFVENVVQRV